MAWRSGRVRQRDHLDPVEGLRRFDPEDRAAACQLRNHSLRRGVGDGDPPAVGVGVGLGGTGIRV